MFLFPIIYCTCRFRRDMNWYNFFQYNGAFMSISMVASFVVFPSTTVVQDLSFWRVSLIASLPKRAFFGIKWKFHLSKTNCQSVYKLPDTRTKTQVLPPDTNQWLWQTNWKNRTNQNSKLAKGASKSRAKTPEMNSSSNMDWNMHNSVTILVW